MRHCTVRVGKVGFGESGAVRLCAMATNRMLAAVALALCVVSASSSPSPHDDSDNVVVYTIGPSSAATELANAAAEVAR